MIVVEAPAYVPYEPQTQELHDLRAELQRQLKELKVGADEIVWAAFAGRLPNGADVENALFYNLDGKGAFARSMDHGVCFELDPGPVEDGVRYSYAVGPKEDGLRYWQAERHLAAVVAEDTQPTLAPIWWALRSTPGAIQQAGESRLPDEPFCLMLDVEGPAKRLTPVLVKGIVDGIVSGLQSQTDLAGAASAAPRIAEVLGAPVIAIQEALTDPAPSALGVRASLVRAWGARVQWAPDDDLCVAARLLFKPARRWTIAGTASVVAPQVP
jgi:hypothetical protein